MIFTTVICMRTEREMTYSLPPREALKAAYLQGKGNHNTWTYDEQEVTIKEGRHHWFCGDFAVRKVPPHTWSGS